MNSEPKVIEVVGGIIRRGDRYLLGKRPIGKAQGGLWDLSAGKLSQVRLLVRRSCENAARRMPWRL